LDLHFTDATATPEERAAVDEALASSETARDMLLPVLHAISGRTGWISEGALNYACERLVIPPAEAYGVATFYALFSTQPRPPIVVHVCDDIACTCAGAAQLCNDLEARYGPAGVHAENLQAMWVRSPCLGLCDRAPAALVIAAGPSPIAYVLGPARAEELRQTLSSGQLDAAAGERAPVSIGGSNVRLLARVGNIDPKSLAAYCDRGGYRALRKALEIGPKRVIEETVAARLLGRGGAAFPTGKKMEAVAAASAQPHYIVCNADESEPGTFKDRVLMEHDPFSLIEGMSVAAFASGCERGFIYVRGEYPMAARRLQHALEAARSANVLGGNIMGSGWRFDIELRRGAGAYICGEETALFNSIEGKRGEPRNKPPFPAQVGLFGKPTLVNNVETLVNLIPIVLDGGTAYASVGTQGSTGTRLFSLSGAVQRPGVYEVPHGTTLAALLEMAGGVRDGRTLRAVLLGGAAGSFVSPQALSLPLSFEAVREAGATLGSGAVILFDDSIALMPVLLRIARFFREESCGQCVPCRVGTVRQEEVLQRLSHSASDADISLLNDIGRAMKDASICGLGQTAANAVASAIGFVT
jgi:NADH-quinone oxidoreductase subunit F